ncbi:N-acetylmuramoyl-L-alanine amidase [Parabacteroides sp. FAFU027]|uniref:N-acetylmuramoyl-L-alanine amidase n=1 Tax=Parabacteroides sp. FAFU027 TaxID=2922715 RepID=UPI001FAFD05E|nr:N-acetylmuramoyl-L-alanine amidase [Parabacteroides sp. FAFU027]
MLPIDEKLLTGYNRPGKNLKKLNGIVVHWTANMSKGANAEMHYRYFNRPKPSTNVVYGSAHYVVDDKTILHLIPDDEEAYHVGAKSYEPLIYSQLGVPHGDSPNYYTIGIEMCVNSDGNIYKTRENTIELIRYLCDKYHLERKDIYRHYDITGKDCPYMMLDNGIWGQFLNAVFNPIPVAPKAYIVTASELNIRKGNGITFPIVGKLNKDDIIHPIGFIGKWFQIGVDKWVHSGYLSLVV